MSTSSHKFVIFDEIEGETTDKPVTHYNVQSADIINLADPSNQQDAATKNYVDANPWKKAVTWATASALATDNSTYTYDNGPNGDGVGATITSVAPGSLTVDGTLVATGDDVLVKDESNFDLVLGMDLGLVNGIYNVTQAGDTGSPWVLTRRYDSDTGNKLLEATVNVNAGTANANTTWTNSAIGPISTGSTDITFLAFGAGAGLVASAPLVLGLWPVDSSYLLGVPVQPSTSGNMLTMCQASDSALSRPVGIIGQSDTLPSLGNAYVVTVGVAVNVLSGANPGDVYYLQPTGGIDVTLPGGGNRIIQIGIAYNSTDLWVRIEDFGYRS